MKKFSLICSALLAALTMSAQDVALDYTTFFATSAINADGVTLEAGAYTSTSESIKKDQWNLTGKTGNQNGVSSTVSANTLSYTDAAGNAFIDNTKGLQINVPNGSAGNRDEIFSLIGASTYTGKAYYASFLLRVDSCSSTDGNDIFAFDGNACANAQRGRVFVKKGTASKTFTLGITYNATCDAKDASGVTSSCGEFALGTTVFVVAKMIPSSTGAESFALYVNPTLESAESANLPVDSGVASGTSYLKAIKGLTIRQRNNIQYTLASLRFADTWDYVVKKAGSTEPTEEVTYLDALTSNFEDVAVWGDTLPKQTSGTFPTTELNNGWTLTAAYMNKSNAVDSLKNLKFTVRCHMDKNSYNAAITTPFVTRADNLYLFASAGSDSKDVLIQTRQANGTWTDLSTQVLMKAYDLYTIPVNMDSVQIRVKNNTSSSVYVWYIGTTYPISPIPEDPTALENVNATEVQKVIENGQMIIIREGVRYSVTGTVIK